MWSSESAFCFPLLSAWAVGHVSFKSWFNSPCGMGCLGFDGGEGGKFVFLLVFRTSSCFNSCWTPAVGAS